MAQGSAQVSLTDCAGSTEMIFQWLKVHILNTENHRPEHSRLSQNNRIVDEEENEGKLEVRSQETLLFLAKALSEITEDPLKISLLNEQ